MSKVVRVKITVEKKNGNEIRRFTIPENSSYCQFQQIIEETLPELHDANYHHFYMDDENEWIKISTDFEFQHALGMYDGKLLRFRLSLAKTTGKISPAKAKKADKKIKKVSPENSPSSGPSPKEAPKGKGKEKQKVEVKSQKAEEKPAFHSYVVCDGCESQGIKGTRYKCVVCDDYDLCDDCHEIREHIHPVHHNFLPIVSPKDDPERYHCESSMNRKETQTSPQETVHITTQTEVRSFTPPTKTAVKECTVKKQEVKAAEQKPQQKLLEPSAPVEEELKYAEELNALVSMGFELKDNNIQLLKKHKGSLERVVNELLMM